MLFRSQALAHLGRGEGSAVQIEPLDRVAEGRLVDLATGQAVGGGPGAGRVARQLLVGGQAEPHGHALLGRRSLDHLGPKRQLGQRLEQTLVQAGVELAQAHVGLVVDLAGRLGRDLALDVAGHLGTALPVLRLGDVAHDRVDDGDRVERRVNRAKPDLVVDRDLDRTGPQAEGAQLHLLQGQIGRLAVVVERGRAAGRAGQGRHAPTDSQRQAKPARVGDHANADLGVGDTLAADRPAQHLLVDQVVVGLAVGHELVEQRFRDGDPHVRVAIVLFEAASHLQKLRPRRKDQPGHRLGKGPRLARQPAAFVRFEAVEQNGQLDRRVGPDLQLGPQLGHRALLDERALAIVHPGSNQPLQDAAGQPPMLAGIVVSAPRGQTLQGVEPEVALPLATRFGIARQRTDSRHTGQKPFRIALARALDSRPGTPGRQHGLPHGQTPSQGVVGRS